MTVTYPILGDIWPYSEAAVPPELATLSVDAFFADQERSSVTTAQWTVDPDPEAAPRSSYAIRLMRSREKGGELAVWKPSLGVWKTVSRFAVPPRADETAHCSIVELSGILLSNVQSPDALQSRINNLLQAEMSEMKVYRIASKVLSVVSIITLFYAVRAGVEANAIEPFALVFLLAFGIGMLAIGLRNRTKVLSERGLARITEQFQFEYKSSEHAPLTIKTVSRILKEDDLKREEDAVIFGFLLFLCFVYFISSLVVVGTIVAVIVVTLMIGDPKTVKGLGLAYDRAETRLQKTFLSFRASDDALAPPALRSAKKEVLRDRMRRYGDMVGKVREAQSRKRLTLDIALAVAFFIIFSSYAFPIAAGFQKQSITLSDSLVSTSLFQVAPVIVLLSVSRLSVALAQIINRRVSNLSR